MTFMIHVCLYVIGGIALHFVGRGLSPKYRKYTTRLRKKAYKALKIHAKQRWSNRKIRSRVNTASTIREKERIIQRTTKPAIATAKPQLALQVRSYIQCSAETHEGLQCIRDSMERKDGSRSETCWQHEGVKKRVKR